MFYLLDYLKSLFKLRDEALTFLFRVQERESILEEMKKTVMGIKSERDIEEEFIIVGVQVKSMDKE